MRTWDVGSMQVQPHHPEVVCSTDEGRAIVVNLPAGDRLSEHEVHEHAWLVVTSGRVEIVEPHDGTVTGGAGLCAHFDPHERHEVRAVEDSRLLLLLTPWPGDGHPSERARVNPAAVGNERR